MENNEREYGENSIYTAAAFGGTSAADLNEDYLEDVKHGEEMAMPVGGDEAHHEAVDKMVDAIQRAAGIEPMPWQRAYLNALTEAAPAVVHVKLLPSRKS